MRIMRKSRMDAFLIESAIEGLGPPLLENHVLRRLKDLKSLDFTDPRMWWRVKQIDSERVQLNTWIGQNHSKNANQKLVKVIKSY